MASLRWRTKRNDVHWYVRIVRLNYDVFDVKGWKISGLVQTFMRPLRAPGYVVCMHSQCATAVYADQEELSRLEHDGRVYCEWHSLLILATQHRARQ